MLFFPIRKEVYMVKKLSLVLLFISFFTILNARLLDSWDPEYDLDSKAWELPYYYLENSLMNANFIEVSGGCTEVHHLNYFQNVSIEQKLRNNIDFLFKWKIEDNLLYHINYYSYGFHFTVYKNLFLGITGNPQFEKKDIDIYLSSGYKSNKLLIEPYMALIKFDNNYSYQYNDLDSMNFYTATPYLFGANLKINTKTVKTYFSGYWVKPYTMDVVLNKDTAYDFSVDSSAFDGFTDIYPLKNITLGCKYHFYRFSRVIADTDSVYFNEWYINGYTGYKIKNNFYYIGLKYVNNHMINYTDSVYNRSVFIPYIGIRGDYKWNKFTFEYMKSIGNINATGYSVSNPHYENRFLFQWDILIGKNTILSGSKGFELDKNDIKNGSKYFFYDKAYIQLITTF